MLYVMSRDQRVEDNFALLAAQQTAMDLGVPLTVVFCLLPHSNDRSREHFEFMINGLEEVEKNLNKLRIPFMLLLGKPLQTLAGMLHHTKPAAVYFDFSPLHGSRTLHQDIAQQSSSAVFEVDTHNIVPVWEASPKQEVGARTLRPKIHHMLPQYLVIPDAAQVHPHPWPGVVRSITELRPKIDEIVQKIPRNGQTVSIVSGQNAALKTLQDFTAKRLPGYAASRNNPTVDGQSELSPYLHFGQLWAGRAVIDAQLAAHHNAQLQPDVDAFVEELVVRRELSDNFCFYNQHYRSLQGAPQWARESLKTHAHDRREHVYSFDQFEQAKTHDGAWNAAQNQLLQTGKMHGYMRMYWAKKVLEWSPSAEDALQTLIKLNDFYSIDGGDPNGYVGILWSIAGLHDRPWFDRPIYGVVRYMNYNGLKRKFNVADYQTRWNNTPQAVLPINE